MKVLVCFSPEGVIYPSSQDPEYEKIRNSLDGVLTSVVEAFPNSKYRFHQGLPVYSGRLDGDIDTIIFYFDPKLNQRSEIRKRFSEIVKKHESFLVGFTEEYSEEEVGVYLKIHRPLYRKGEYTVKPVKGFEDVFLRQDYVTPESLSDIDTSKNQFSEEVVNIRQKRHVLIEEALQEGILHSACDSCPYEDTCETVLPDGHLFVRDPSHRRFIGWMDDDDIRKTVISWLEDQSSLKVTYFQFEKDLYHVDPESCRAFHVKVFLGTNHDPNQFTLYMGVGEEKIFADQISDRTHLLPFIHLQGYTLLPQWLLYRFKQTN